jgi:hypothetical protein
MSAALNVFPQFRVVEFEALLLPDRQARSKSNAMIGDRSNDTKNQPTPLRPREFAATPMMIETITHRITTANPPKSINSRCHLANLPQPEGESKRVFPAGGELLH